MDKSWISKPRHSNQYLKGVDTFLDFAFSRGVGLLTGQIQCPCRFCDNENWENRDVVRQHLVVNGMVKGYAKRWRFHGEGFTAAGPSIDPQPPHVSSPAEQCDMFNLVSDAFGIRHTANGDVDMDESSKNDNENNESEDDTIPNIEPTEDGLNESDDDTIPNIEPTEDGLNQEHGLNEDQTFFKFIEEGNQELYPGSKSTVLLFTVQLMHIKTYNKWSEHSVTMLLDFLKLQFPHSNIPRTFYEAKKMTNALGLGYEKIDVCRNNCMLYRGVRATQESCHVCNSSRWQHDDSISGNKRAKRKTASKIMRYFPLIPRLQRLYMSSKTSSEMIWHDKDRTKDGLLRHPADSPAWKTFDQNYPDFAQDPRNVRLALASDGFNPYGLKSHSYSVWPVILMPYNLPPWLSMQQSSLILSTIIPGKDSPGDKIDIFLQPLIDELLQLWEGVQTYDASSKQTFMMRAALMWTINDFPAYANLSGWSTRGKKACPCCADMTVSQWLHNGRKFCYMAHRRWLDESHKFRGQKHYFDGTEERRTTPKTLSGSDALRQLRGIGFIDEVVTNIRNEASSSKKRKKKVVSNEDDSFVDEEIEEGEKVICEATPWKKKSIFFKLPYWEFNSLRHNLDVMHVEKNVCENILGTLLNIKGKSKDDLNARRDLELMNIRHKLHPIEHPNGSVFCPPASYSMTRKEKEVFLSVLKNVKVPDGYASQISRGINVEDRKLQALKTHDYHILMQDLLPIALRSCMNKQVTKLIIELSNIFKGICGKTLNLDELVLLKSRAILVLCHMERCFPPSFFTIMVHLVIHLVDETMIAGPVRYRWMYPIERCWKEFKKFVGNKAYPEGSIAEGYIANECHTFCSRYFKGIETIFNRPRRNNDIEPIERDKYLFSSGGKFIGAAKVIELNSLSLIQAHRYVLLHLEEINSYIEEFKMFKINNNRRFNHNPTALQRVVAEEFHEWFKIHVANMDKEDVPERVKWLSLGPSLHVRTFKGFIINGVKFRTKEGNWGKRSQNYGVVLTSRTPSIASSRDRNLVDGEVEYFGELTEIVELNYSGKLKVVLFRCDWADGTRERGVKKDEYGFTLVNFTKLSHTGDRIVHEPFVIASQVQQAFFVEDPLIPPWRVVIKTVPRDVFDLGVDGQSVIEDDSFQNPEFARNVPYERQELEESDWARDDINEDLLCDVVQQS